LDFSYKNNAIISHAEYEQSEELIITSNHGSLYMFDEPYFIDIIRFSEKALSVRINVNNFIQKNRVISQLNNEGIPIDNITISIIPTSSIWIRDYGPFFIEKEGELSIVDFNYLGFRLRLLDNIYPTLYALKNKIDFNFKANFGLCIQGGNYMVDRKGIGMVSADTLESDNADKTINEMSGILKKYLGLNEVLFLESQKDDGTGHIDMYSKLIDDNTVLVGQWDAEDINYHILENDTQLLVNSGYNVIRIPMLRDPDKEKGTIWTYTNSLIINGTNKNMVLVPTYGVDEDLTAISIYEQAMPDYEIIGIDCRPLIDLLGAIHCSTILRPNI
jgi:agmatine/peptidylarginine deiminase